MMRILAFLWFVVAAQAQFIGNQPTIYPSQGSSGTPGSLCWREGRATGTNVVCLSVPDSIAADVTTKLPGTAGGTAQILNIQSSNQLGWVDYFQFPSVVRTSSTRLTIGSNCSSTMPCNWRIGALTTGITTSTTIDVVSGTGTLEVKLNSSGSIVTYTTGTLSISCGGGGCASGLSGYSPQLGYIPLYEWVASAGAWSATGTDLRSPMSSGLILAAGTNMTVSSSSTAAQVAADLSATWRFTGIVGVPSSAPGTPANGDIWYDTGTSKFKCRQGGSTVDCITGTTTAAYPLNEIKITDSPYSAASDCSASINTAFATALAALPTDQGGKKSGIITFPAGCYAVDVSSGTAPLLIARASGYGDVTLKGAGAGNEFAVVGAGTEIKVTSSAPATDTPIVEFRNTLGGGIQDIEFNANGVAKTRIIKIRESRFGTIFNVQGRRWTSGPGLEFASETGASSGGCHWNITGLRLGDVKDTDDAAGILFDGQVTGYSACSNQITHATVIYSKSGSTSYGVKFKYADNNQMTRANVWASDCTAFPCESNFGTGRLNGTRPALTFEQWTSTSDRTFPKENWFQGTLAAQAGYMITGVSGTSGNIVDYAVDDCGSPGVTVSACFPTSIRNITGRTPSGFYGGRNAVAFPTPDANYPSWSLDQTDSGFTHAGRINFARLSRVRGAIAADRDAGITFSVSDACSLLATVGGRSPHAASNTLTNIVVSAGTATATVSAAHDCTTSNRVRVTESTGAVLDGEFKVTAVTSTTISWTSSASSATYNNDGLTIEVAPYPRWNISTAGTMAPTTNGEVAFGSSTKMPSATWGQTFRSYTNSAYGTQTSQLQSDAQTDLNIDSYGTDRPGLNLRQAAGTLASPTDTPNNTRVGVVAGWGKATAGFAVATRLNSYVDTGGANLTASLRVGISNAGTVTDTVTFNGSGGVTIAGIAFASLPSSTNGTVLYCTDCTRTTTCAGSGTGAIAERLNGAWSCADASGGSGTVTSIATTSPITGGTITSTGTIACPTCVTSAASLTSNAVMIGGGSQASSTISASTTTTHVLHATAGAPAFAAITDADVPDTITASNYLPLAGGAMTGAITGATRYDSSSSSAVDHIWQADSGNLNLYLDSANSSSANRTGLNMRRARGSNASPSTLSSGDRVSVIANWAYTSSGYAVASTINTYADTVGASTTTSSLRFGTANAGSSTTDWIYINGDGGMQWITGTKPTCNSAHRGTVFYVAGGAGVKDTFEVCTKNASDVYAWAVLY